MNEKQLKTITYSTNADGDYVTYLTFDDNSEVTIIVTFGMIFVGECAPEELNRRIISDEYTFEAYDTIDGCSYYFSSVYAEYVSDTLISIANKYFTR